MPGRKAKSVGAAAIYSFLSIVEAMLSDLDFVVADVVASSNGRGKKKRYAVYISSLYFPLLKLCEHFCLSFCELSSLYFQFFMLVFLYVCILGCLHFRLK